MHCVGNTKLLSKEVNDCRQACLVLLITICVHCKEDTLAHLVNNHKLLSLARELTDISQAAPSQLTMESYVRLVHEILHRMTTNDLMMQSQVEEIAMELDLYSI